jgi:hypothetical protein
MRATLPKNQNAAIAVSRNRRVSQTQPARGAGVRIIAA